MAADVVGTGPMYDIELAPVTDSGEGPSTAPKGTLEVCVHNTTHTTVLPIVHVPVQHTRHPITDLLSL